MTEKEMTKQEIYMTGFKDALKAFAFWKDGKQYVGTSSVKSLDDALKNPQSIYGFDNELYNSLGK